MLVEQGRWRGICWEGESPTSGCLEGPVVWLMCEYTWYQAHTRADTQLSREDGVTSAKGRDTGKMEPTICYLEHLSLKSGSKNDSKAYARGNTKINFCRLS